MGTDEIKSEGMHSAARVAKLSPHVRSLNKKKRSGWALGRLLFSIGAVTLSDAPEGYSGVCRGS